MPALDIAKYASSESASGIGESPMPSNPLDRRLRDVSEFGGCAHRSKTPPTVTEIANPVRRDLPVYSEWIDATVSYIDSHIHVSRDRRPHSNGGRSRPGQRAVCPACMRNSRRVDRFQAWLLYFWCRPRTVSFIAKTFVMAKSNPVRAR